ncbi:hypothetical protein SLS57_012537, partial [Botryosphaeria dothidea]
MIDKAQATVQTSVNIEVLFEIIRKESNVKPGYPFEARMGEDTKQRYKQAWQRVIGALWDFIEEARLEWAEGEAAEPAVPVNESVENENEEEEIEFEFKEE